MGAAAQAVPALAAAQPHAANDGAGTRQDAAGSANPLWPKVYDDDDSCVYQYIDAKFVCEYSTYKYFSDGSVRENDRESEPVYSIFDVPGFISRVRQSGCIEQPDSEEP